MKVILFLMLIVGCQKQFQKETFFKDPLPSWNSTYVKKAIIEFVTNSTTKGKKGFIPIESRIATFDTDGTLWAEQPLVQGLFALEQAKEIGLNLSPIKEMDEKEFLKLLVLTHTGMTNEDFSKKVTHFFEKTEHPKFQVSFNHTIYRPQVELINYLKKNNFKVFISADGTADFIREISEKYFQIPKERVIGTNFEYSYREGLNTLVRLSKIDFINDKENKPAGIQRNIGRRPVFACGNVRSGGDIYMLRYSQGSQYPNFQLLINHDDAIREFSYKEPDDISLKWAKKYHFNIVSMKNDWKEIFPAEEVRLTQSSDFKSR